MNNLLGYTGKSTLDSGYFYAPYMPLLTANLVSGYVGPCVELLPDVVMDIYRAVLNEALSVSAGGYGFIVHESTDSKHHFTILITGANLTQIMVTIRNSSIIEFSAWNMFETINMYEDINFITNINNIVHDIISKYVPITKEWRIYQS